MSKVLTPARRARLEKLAAYLEGLPADYSHFDMGHWVGGSTSKAERKYARKNGGVSSCGTSACAAGHGPAAGVLVPASFVLGTFVDWRGYALNFLAGGDHSLYLWMFDGDWDAVDNGHYGAAARIRYALANDGPPEDYECDPEEDYPALYAPYRIDAKAQANA